MGRRSSSLLPRSTCKEEGLSGVFWRPLHMWHEVALGSNTSKIKIVIVVYIKQTRSPWTMEEVFGC